MPPGVLASPAATVTVRMLLCDSCFTSAFCGVAGTASDATVELLLRPPLFVELRRLKRARDVEDMRRRASPPPPRASRSLSLRSSSSSPSSSDDPPEVEAGDGESSSSRSSSVHGWWLVSAIFDSGDGCAVVLRCKYGECGMRAEGGAVPGDGWCSNELVALCPSSGTPSHPCSLSLSSESESSKAPSPTCRRLMWLRMLSLGLSLCMLCAENDGRRRFDATRGRCGGGRPELDSRRAKMAAGTFGSPVLGLWGDEPFEDVGVMTCGDL